MTNTRGKRRGTRYMFSRAFRKHGEFISERLKIYWNALGHFKLFKMSNSRLGVFLA